MGSIFENATIIQKNGVKQLHAAILVMDKGIYTGILKTQNGKEQQFEEHSYIPRDQIEKVVVCNESGTLQDIEI